MPPLTGTLSTRWMRSPAATALTTARHDDESCAAPVPGGQNAAGLAECGDRKLAESLEGGISL